MEQFDCPGCHRRTVVPDESLGIEQVCSQCGQPWIAEREPTGESMDVAGHAARLPMGPLAALWLAARPDAGFGLVQDTLIVSFVFASGEGEDDVCTFAFLNSQTADELAEEVARVLRTPMPYEAGRIRSCITHASSGRRRDDAFQIPYNVTHWVVFADIPGPVEIIGTICRNAWRVDHERAKSGSIWTRPFLSFAPKVRVLTWDRYDSLENLTGIFLGLSYRRIARHLRKRGVHWNPERVFRQRLHDFGPPSASQLMIWCVAFMGAAAFFGIELRNMWTAHRAGESIPNSSYFEIAGWFAVASWAAASIWRGLQEHLPTEEV